MKKLILILTGILFCSIIYAQKPFVLLGHAPDNLFTKQTHIRGITATGAFLWSLDAIIGGFELNYDPDSTRFNGSLLSAVGAAAGYKHYKPSADGTPVSDWGINLGIMTKVKINETIQTKLKIALLGNYYNLMAGPVYTPSEIRGKKFGLLVGANIQF